MIKSARLKGCGGNKCTTGCVRRDTLAVLVPSFSILTLAQGVKVQGFNYRSLRPHKFLWLPKNVRTPKYSYLQALLVKCAIDT